MTKNISSKLNAIIKGINIFIFLLIIIFLGFLFTREGCGCGPHAISTSETRDNSRYDDLNYIKNGLTLYLQKYKETPIYNNFTGTDALKIHLVRNFLKSIPSTPNENQKYYYKSVNITGFVLVAEMETTKYSCNLVASNLDEVNQRLSDKSILEIQTLLSSYDKKNDKKCFYVLAN